MKLVDAVAGAWREQVTQAIRTLKTWPWVDTLRTLRIRFREDRLGLTASSLTFTTLVSLVPLVTVMLAVFSAFPIFSAFQEALQRYFLQTLVPDNIARQVLTTVTQFAAKAKGVGSAGVMLLFAAALALMLTIDRTLNSIWRVRQPRPIAQRVLVYWAAATLGPLVLGISLSLTSYAISASQGFVNATARRGEPGTVGHRIRAAGGGAVGPVPLRAQYPTCVGTTRSPAACAVRSRSSWQARARLVPDRWCRPIRWCTEPSPRCRSC